MAEREKAQRRSGINTIAYLGVEPYTPPQFYINDRAPTTHDSKGFNIGCIWLHKDESTAPKTYDIWMLVSLSAHIAIWIRLVGFNLALSQGVVQVTGTGTIFSSSGANGQVIISGGPGFQPVWANITSSGGTIAITNGAGTINIEAVGVAGLTQLTSDTGVVLPLVGNINAFGGDNINTDNLVANTLTINLNEDVILPVTGSLTLQALGAGVVQSTAAGLLFSNKGTDGQVIIGSTAGAPAWGSITSAGGTITITVGANTINIESAAVGPAEIICNVTTNNANPTLLVNNATPQVVPAGQMVTIKGYFDALRDTITDAAGGEFCFSAYRPAAGNVTLIGVPIVNINATALIDVQCVVDVGTQTVQVNVVGIAGQTWNWRAWYRVYLL